MNYYAKVNDQGESRRLQRAAFAAGFSWGEDGRKLQYLDSKVLFLFYEDMTLRHSRVTYVDQNDDWGQGITLEEMFDMLGQSLYFGTNDNATCALHKCMEAFYNEGSF